MRRLLRPGSYCTAKAVVEGFLKFLKRISFVLKPDRLLLSSLDEESKQRNQATIITSTRIAYTPPELWRASAPLESKDKGPLIISTIFLAIFSLLITSCLRVEQIAELNLGPVLLINGQENMVIDSVKVKGGTARYIFDLIATDPDENLKSISYEILSGDGSLFQNGIVIDEIQLGDSETISLGFTPARTGTHILNFNIADVFDREASITLDLYAFENIVPISQFDLVKPEVQHDQLEYLIDASPSYDPDEKFGGGITSYEYAFLGKTVVLSSSTIGIIFPENGTYDIGVRIKDNDGEWSDETIRSFKVN